MPEPQVSAAAGVQMLAGAKGPRGRQTLRKLGLGRPGEALKPAKGKEQQLGPPWPDEAAGHGQEKATRPPVSTPQRQSERTICLRSQACWTLLRPSPSRPAPIGVGVLGGRGVCSQLESCQRRDEKWPQDPGPCLPLSIEPPASGLSS